MKSDKSCKILVGYDPGTHLTLVGLEKSEQEKIIDLQAANYENMVIIVSTNRRFVMVTAVTDNTDATSIYLEQEKISNVLRTIYFCNKEIEYFGIATKLVFPETSLKDLQTTVNFFPESNLFIVTKEDLKNRTWIKDLIDKFNTDLKSTCPNYSRLPAQPLEILTGSLMCSMSQTQIFLPKVTHDIPTKLTTILLNSQQINAITHTSQWKILNAPFGGGKTVILAEIAKNLLKVRFYEELFYL